MRKWMDKGENGGKEVPRPHEGQVLQNFIINIIITNIITVQQTFPLCNSMFFLIDRVVVLRWRRLQVTAPQH